MVKIIFHIGDYFLLLRRVFRKPEKHRMYWQQAIKEMVSIGIGSISIVCIISIFMGAVITIQSSANTDSSWIPAYLIGFTARESILLEFSSSIVGLILAGKVGSSIASELGTMRVTEQIDALEIMGINSASYLILPKILASCVILPLLMYISMFVGIGGAWAAGVLSGVITSADFVQGIHYDFKPFSIVYATIKMVFFAFAISSIPSYHGYKVRGGALDVAKASTQSVVYSSIAILILNYLLTQMLLL